MGEETAATHRRRKLATCQSNLAPAYLCDKFRKRSLTIHNWATR